MATASRSSSTEGSPPIENFPGWVSDAALVDLDIAVEQRAQAIAEKPARTATIGHGVANVDVILP